MRWYVILAFVMLAAPQIAMAIDVYIVAGQSNGWRLSSIAAYPNRTDKHKIYYFPMACGSRPTTAKLQVLDSLHPSAQGKGLAAELLRQADDDIVIFQYCVCGTSLYNKINWYPGDDPAAGELNDEGLYASFLTTLTDARAQAELLGLDWQVKALFWHQGESDAANMTLAATYETNFRHLVTRLRSDLGEDLPIIAGHVRDLNDAYRTVNAAMDAVAADDQRMVTVSGADLTFESPTDVHFNTPGCHEFGRRLGVAYHTLQQRAAP
jgi:hypothetical protein